MKLNQQSKSKEKQMNTKKSNDNGQAKSLTPKQYKALPLLVAGKTGVEVAQAVNINPATISIWLNHDQKFIKELRQIRQEALWVAHSKLQSLATDAITNLRTLVTCAESEQVKLKAIELVLSTLKIDQIQNDYLQSGNTDQLDPTAGGQTEIDKILNCLEIHS